MESGIWDNCEMLISFRCQVPSFSLTAFPRRQLKTMLQGHSSTVRCAIALSSKKAITSSRDTTLKIWDVETGACEATLEGHTGTVRSMARHGDLVVSVSYDNDARIWSLEKKECVHILKGHAAQIYAVAFDGARIVTGSLDTTARVWDPRTGYVFRSFFCTYIKKTKLDSCIGNASPFWGTTQVSCHKSKYCHRGF